MCDWGWERRREGWIGLNTGRRTAWTSYIYNKKRNTREKNVIEIGE